MEKTIGERIRQRRKGLRRSAEWLASEVGCSQSTISQYERDVRNPNTEMLVKIANALECRLEDIVSREDLVRVQDAALEIIRQVDNSTFEHCCFDSSPSKYLEQLQEIKKVTPQLMNLHSGDHLLASNAQVMSSVSNIFQHTLDSLDDLFGDGSGRMLFRIADILYKLNIEGQQRVFDYLDDISGNPKYQREKPQINDE